MEAIGRRGFLGYLTGGAALLAMGGGGAIAVVGMEGCNATDVWHEIEAWVPMGIDAFDSIIMLVDPLMSPAVLAIANLVKASFASLAAAIDDYLNAPAASKATLGAKIKLILSDLAAHIQDFLTAIGQTSNPILKIVAALVSVLVNVIGGFINAIAGSPSATARLFRPTFQVGGETITVQPTRMTKKQFIAAFNSACDANFKPELHIPRLSQ